MRALISGASLIGGECIPRRAGRTGRAAEDPARLDNPCMSRVADINVVGGELQECSAEPLTGFYRDGCCATGPEDAGSHTVCAIVTAEFLRFSRLAGNDLSAPAPHFGFPGLEPGDRWCVCAATWREAYEAGTAAPVVLAATHEETLAVIPLDALRAHALDLH